MSKICYSFLQAKKLPLDADGDGEVDDDDDDEEEEAHGGKSDTPPETQVKGLMVMGH